MDKMVTDSNLSSSLQTTTVAVGAALVLVAGVALHQNKDRISSLFIENISSEEMRRNTDWEKLSIPAQVRLYSLSSNIGSCLIGGATDSYFSFFT